MLIFGCGYLGQRVARRLLDGGKDVHVFTRSPERAESLTGKGYRTLVGDVTRPETLRDLPAAETVLFAVGFDRLAHQSVLDVYPVGLKNVLNALPAGVKQLVYISTTGVYGSADGGWVDEQTSPAPHRDGGRASLAAEEVLAGHPLGKTSLILRLAGIYGPGRIPYQDKLRAGEPLAAPSEGWLNLIHVDDAASIVLAAADWNLSRGDAAGPHIFCVADGQPVVRGNYYREVARRIGAPPPKFVSPDLSSPAAARAAADKRVSSDKLFASLGVQLEYPSYREGLEDALTEHER